jgi:hypothetical protein
MRRISFCAVANLQPLKKTNSGVGLAGRLTHFPVKIGTHLKKLATL